MKIKTFVEYDGRTIYKFSDIYCCSATVRETLKENIIFAIFDKIKYNEERGQDTLIKIITLDKE
jgi:hypothetical protein